jgi:drug/metabolite transporter (DMT)-like permease
MELSTIYLLVSILLGATGQVIVKHGLNTLGSISLSLSWTALRESFLRIGTNPYVLAGWLIYAGAAVLWLLALSRMDLSYAYPFVSLSYILMLFASWMFLDEAITPMRLLGTAIVCLGVLVVART